MTKVRIAHLTTVHPRIDARICLKEAGTLARFFAEPVALFVQDGKGDSSEAGGMIEVIDIGPAPSSRLARMVSGGWRMGRAVLLMRPQIVHFHDPELILLGFVLKCFGFKVIYDVHEDVPLDVLTKFWLPTVIRRPISWLMSVIEWLAGRSFTAIVSATPDIGRRFPVKKTVLVQNYPILNELVGRSCPDYQQRPPHFAFVGGIGRTRGIQQMVESLTFTGRSDIRLQLAGKFQPVDLMMEMEALDGWRQVEFLTWVNRVQVSKILSNVRAGLVLYHPTPGILNAYPTKMFEYMSVGLPVIASDFPAWRHIVDRAECGLLVNPLEPSAIADAMLWLLNNPQEAEMMGRRARKAAEEFYSWEREGDKLIRLYKKLLSYQRET
ncbi:MAG: glycosyltransferase family 4 protein [Gammaproteobacteria bacterium]|nr:glycosyltransferase family 4 protein [Gammaproteobacteria bacterium]